jgi:hypothetical protein
VLEQLGISVPLLVGLGDTDVEPTIADEALGWIKELFIHRRFRLPTHAEGRATWDVEGSLVPQLVPSQVKYGLTFFDGVYDFDSIAGDAFSFDTTDPHFGNCVDQLIRLLTNPALALKLQRAGPGAPAEGSLVTKLYTWLYSCFMSGCSDDIERTWHDPYVLKTSKDWRPDGIIGYTRSVLASVQADFAACRVSEGVYLGLAAIEHKKQLADDTDLYFSLPLSLPALFSSGC